MISGKCPLFLSLSVYSICMYTYTEFFKRTMIQAFFKKNKYIFDYEPVALTVMVTLTGSFSSPGVGTWPVVGVALWGEMVRGEDALGIAMVGPGGDQH